MSRYQPLNWVNEWKLLIYNIKVLGCMCVKPMLNQRINQDTYGFLLFLSWGFRQSSLLFISPFIRYEVFSRDLCMYFAFAIHVWICVFGLFILGRRLQDWGIPWTLVLLLLGGCLWGTYHLGYPMFFNINNPFIRVSSYKGIFLDIPQYMEWVAGLCLLGCFIPDNKRKNRFGEPLGWGIILWGKQISNKDNSRMFQYNPIKDLDELKIVLIACGQSIRALFSRALDFKGRSSYDEFAIAGLIMLILQWISATFWYTGHFVDVDIYISTCMVLHILFLIPSFSLFTRRLHDCYCSALWIPFMYVPMINLFVYAILLFGKSWEIEDFHLEEGDRL